MKKIFYAFACVLMAFAMSSCSPNTDNGGDTAEKTLIGSWKTTKYDWTSMKNGQLVSSGTEYYDEDEYMLWTYRADGSFVDMTIEEGEPYQYVGTWVATSDKLYMNYMGDDYKWSDVYNISKLTSTSLVIKFTETEVESDGSTWYYVTEYTFTKQK